MDSIFVSYRRSDSQGEAGRLFDDLAKNFGEDKVFMDVAAIEAGRDFRKAIEEGVTKCGVLLVMIGLDWLDAKDERGVQRLADPSDFVRIETASALKRDIPVIPVLVRGARMPAAEQLPDELKELAYRNCIELTHARWKSDVQLLVAALTRLICDRDAANAPSASRDRQETGATLRVGGGAPVAFRADDLDRLTRELAVYIGPIASVIVKRAAAQSASRDELCARVAEEIEEQEDCERFLRKVGTSGVLPRWDRAAPLPGAPAGVGVRKTPRVEPDTEVAKDVGPEAPQPAQEARTSFRKYGLLSLALIVLVLVAGALLMRPTSSRGKRPSSEPTQAAASSGNGENGAAKNVPASASQEMAGNSHAAAQKSGEPGESGRAFETPQPKPQATGSPTLPVSGDAVRVSEDTSKMMLIHEVMPVYPILARQGRIQGMVVLDADISKDGVVTNLRIVSGHPLLVPPTLSAVTQYRYKPYVQDGKALPMTTQITVNFVLSQQ